MLQTNGLTTVRRSELIDLGDGSHSAITLCSEADVVLGDSLGEMPWYYAQAHVAIVAGSFAPLGGQNFIEHVPWACRLWWGPTPVTLSKPLPMPYMKKPPIAHQAQLLRLSLRQSCWTTDSVKNAWVRPESIGCRNTLAR